MSERDSNYRIDVNDEIHVSPLQPEDADAFAELLNDREIYNRTLRVPYPYARHDAEGFLQFAAKSTTEHGHPMHFAIRNSSDKAIGGFGFEGVAKRTSRGNRLLDGRSIPRPRLHDSRNCGDVSIRHGSVEAGPHHGARLCRQRSFGSRTGEKRLCV